MAHLQIRLLGGIDIRVSGQPDATLSIKKAQALLAYLALHPGQQQPRDKLAALLWGEMANEFARTNLRQALAVLRKSLAHNQCPCVLNAGNNLYLDGDQAEIDVVRFEQYCDQATPAALEEAAALYQGEFLEGFSICEEAFEHWLMTERRRLHERQLQVLNTLLAYYLGHSQYDLSIDIAVRLLALDPLQESVHRALMQCYHALGMRGSVQRQYEYCREILQQELGIEPETGTRQLYRQLLKQPGEPVTVASASIQNPSENQPVTLMPATAEGSITPATKPAGRASLIISAILIVILVGFIGYWRIWQNSGSQPAEHSQTILHEPGKPSIVVLPFDNISDDPEQEYFADGMTEDLITDLSKLPELFVISSNSSFSYKDKPIQAHHIAQELGVRYVLEGSVRRADESVRITAQLIDADTGGHLWAERYNGSVADVFALQDRINHQIITALRLELSPAAKTALQSKDTMNVEAHDIFLRGLRLFNLKNRSGGRWEASDTQAQKAFAKAIELDPDYALPYAGLGLVYWQRFIANFDMSWRQRALELADKSLALAENALALRLRARQYFALDAIGMAGAKSVVGNQYDLAIAELRRALTLAPNDADTLADLADTLVFAGEAEEASELIRQAMRLNPNFPAWYYRPAGIAYYMNGQYPEAIQEFNDWYESEVIKSVSIPWLAAAQAQAGNLDKAHQVVAQVDSSSGQSYGIPPFLQTTYFYYPFKKKVDIEHLIDGLRKAGWPDADKL